MTFVRNVLRRIPRWCGRTHEHDLQSRTIFRQSGSPKATSIRVLRVLPVATMRDQAAEIQATAGREIADDEQVGFLPFRRDANARLAHEGRGECERQRLAVEAREHHLAAVREPRDQAVEQRGIAARVVDRFVVAARIVGGVDDVVAFGADCAQRIAFPYGRRRARRRASRDVQAAARVRRGPRSVPAYARSAPTARAGPSRPARAARPVRPGDPHTACARRPGTMSRLAAPPNRPRTAPKQFAPGTNTLSPTR